MYYITNQNDHIIAIDPDLLTYLEVENIEDLYRDIAIGDIHFSLLKEENKVTITKAHNKKIYNTKSTDLSSMLGNMTLVQIHIFPENPSLMDDGISAFPLAQEDKTSSITEDDNESIEDLLSLDVMKKEKIMEEKIMGEEKKDDVPFDLLLPSVAEETIGKITITEDEETTTDDGNLAPIVIDVKNISQSIGISTEEYNTFLNEYIDTALSLEKDLQSSDQEKRSHAIDTLSHLSNVLHLPAVTDIVTQIGNATAKSRGTHIKSFYTTLGRLTTSLLDTDNTGDSSISFIEPDTKAQTLDFEDTENVGTYEENPLFAPQTEFTETTEKSFGSINLDDVKPIHFDFQLKQAANELNLPVALIEEFVRDFIEQAHTETKKMLEAYKKGDLDTIQKIGHLLKGTSSNLRIIPLSDTLYEIQVCEDINKLEGLIKRYWGHFLSLETQINIKGK